MSDKFIVKGLGGKKTLSGKIKVNGAKNAILKAMASSILFRDGIDMQNIPNIEDVKRLSELLEKIGLEVTEKSKGKYRINTKKIKEWDLDREISEKIEHQLF